MLLALIGLRRSACCCHDKAEHADGQALERAEIRRICMESDRRYGYRRVAQAPRRTTGLAVSGKTALKAMRQGAALHRGGEMPEAPILRRRVGETAPNLLYRGFRPDKPTRNPIADVTGFKVAGAKPCPSPVIDLCNDEVAAYSISRPPNMNMVQRMLAGLEGRLDGKAVLHSDRGGGAGCPSARRP